MPTLSVILVAIVAIVAIVLLWFFGVDFGGLGFGNFSKAKTSGMRAMNPIPYDWDIKEQPIITTNNIDLSELFQQVIPPGANGRSFISPAV
jgi:hypothetical protein